jgi:HK97 family phage portal protein
MVVGHLVLQGNAFAQKVYRNDGALAMLVPLHPGRIQALVGGPEGFFYRYQPKTGPVRDFLPSELFRVLAFSRDMMCGRSPIEVNRDAVAIGVAMDQFVGRFFANDANPGGILKVKGKLGDDDFKRLRDEWNAEHRRGGQHSVAIMEDGMEWAQVGMKLVDAQFIESRKFQVTEVARIFRVPPHMIGDLDRSTNNNIEQQSLEFVQSSLMPWLTRIEGSIWRDLLEPMEQEGGLYAEFLVDAMQRADLKTRYEAYQIGRFAGILSPNEVREKENMNPRDDPGGDEYLTPSNMMPVPNGGGASSPQQAGPAIALALVDPLHRLARRQTQILRDGVKRGKAIEPDAAGFQEAAERMVSPILLPAMILAAVAIGRPPAAETLLLTALAREIPAWWSAVRGLGTTEADLAAFERDWPTAVAGRLANLMLDLLALPRAA